MAESDEAMSALEPDQALVLRKIKEILSSGGRVLSREEAVAFIQAPMHLAKPVERPGRRGPKKSRSQYDDAFDRRRGMYHRLARLPEARRATAKPLRERVQRLADEAMAAGFSGRKLTGAVLQRLQLEGFCHDRTTVMRILKNLHYLK